MSRFDEDNTKVLSENLYSTIDSNDSSYSDLFKKIIEKTEALEEDGFRLRVESVLSIEFLVVRLRLLITQEHSNVKTILNKRDCPPTWIPIFKKRDVHLSALQQRLTDLRLDVEVLQRLIHSYKTINFR
jgi:hypothetical protein